MREYWEYKVVRTSSDMTIEELNRLGIEEGWELATVVWVPTAKYVCGTKIDSYSMIYYFKRRPKEIVV